MRKPTEFPQSRTSLPHLSPLALAEAHMAEDVMRLAQALAEVTEAADAQAVAFHAGNDAYQEARMKTAYAEATVRAVAMTVCRTWSEVTRCRIDEDRAQQERQDALQLDAPAEWEVA